MLLPLISRGRRLGILGLDRREDEPFGQDEVGFLTPVAKQFAIAVENATAYRYIADLKDKPAARRAGSLPLNLENRSRTSCADRERMRPLQPQPSKPWPGEATMAPSLTARDVARIDSPEICRGHTNAHRAHHLVPSPEQAATDQLPVAGETQVQDPAVSFDKVISSDVSLLDVAVADIIRAMIALPAAKTPRVSFWRCRKHLPMPWSMATIATLRGPYAFLSL